MKKAKWAGPGGTYLYNNTWEEKVNESLCEFEVTLSIQQVPGQPELQSETLSQKKNVENWTVVMTYNRVSRNIILGR